MKGSKSEVVKDDSLRDKVPYIDFIKKNIKVVIRYASGHTKIYEKPDVSIHHIDIDGNSYMIVPEAFYLRGKHYYIEYFFGNPRPIVFKFNSQGIVVAGKGLKKELIGGQIKDAQGNVISIEAFEGLPYDKKILFPGIAEIDSVMFNRVLTQKATKDLWGSDDMLGGKKFWIFVILVVIAIGITAFMMYKKLHTGG